MNLAVDEQLAKCAGQTGRRVLRLWWGSNPTAVLGCADKPETALNLHECERRGVGWVKRVTGGGTVLQAPGVFNYSYTAPSHGQMDMRRTFERGTELVVGILAQLGVSAQQRGVSDVAVGDLKISGNAQARKWRSVLLHGTVLVDVDYDLLEAVLRHPHREPDYRQGRSHRDFLTSLRDLGVDASFVDVERAAANAAKRLELGGMMSDSCCSCRTYNKTGECPLCGAVGQLVPEKTVRSLVAGISIPPGDFHACMSPDCEAIYFSRNTVIRQASVAVPVGWKAGATPKYACYCNHVTEDQVISAVVVGGARTVADVSRLTGAMRNGNCLMNNPKGRCCHEDIERLIRRALGQ